MIFPMLISNYVIIQKLNDFQTTFAFCFSASPNKESDVQVHDWLFINYTYKRFDGLTAKPKSRVPPPTTTTTN